MLQQWVKDEPMIPACCHSQWSVISSPRTPGLSPLSNRTLSRKKGTMLPKLSYEEAQQSWENSMYVYIWTHMNSWLDMRVGMPQHMCRSQKGTSNDVSHLPPQDRDLLLCPHYIHQVRWSAGFWGFSCLQLLCIWRNARITEAPAIHPDVYGIWRFELRSSHLQSKRFYPLSHLSRPRVFFLILVPALSHHIHWRKTATESGLPSGGIHRSRKEISSLLLFE